VKIIVELGGIFFHPAAYALMASRWAQDAVFECSKGAFIGIYVAEMGVKVYNKISVRQYFRRHIKLLKMG
jgi:hypothetical protein